MVMFQLQEKRGGGARGDVSTPGGGDHVVMFQLQEGEGGGTTW